LQTFETGGILTAFDMRKNQQPATSSTTKTVVVKNVNSVRIQAESGGIRFASNDSVKSASHWALGKYAATFNKLAQ
jgi:hypothetical protein